MVKLSAFIHAGVLLATVLLLSGSAFADPWVADRISGPLGQRGDLPIAGDFDADGSSDDIGFYRPSDRSWTFDYNADGRSDRTTRNWGIRGDLPIAGDFDADGLSDDIAVFRPSERHWYFDFNADGDTNNDFGPWGSSGDLPLAGDFDGNGLFNDIGFFRPSDMIWRFDYFADGTTDRTIGPWGRPGDLPIPNAGNFESASRDICNDIGVFRPSGTTWNWYFDWNSNGNTDRRLSWAVSGDLPVAGDFDGDRRRDDVAAFRPSTGMWYFYCRLGASAF